MAAVARRQYKAAEQTAVVAVAGRTGAAYDQPPPLYSFRGKYFPYVRKFGKVCGRCVRIRAINVVYLLHFFYITWRTVPFSIDSAPTHNGPQSSSQPSFQLIALGLTTDFNQGHIPFSNGQRTDAQRS